MNHHSQNIFRHARACDYLPKITVAPVSGHGMVEQVGIMVKLAESGYRPQVGLGASGGSLALGLMNLNNWDSREMINWLNRMPSFETFRPNMFGIAAGITSPYIYDPGQGLEYIFTRISCTNVHRQNEIVITTQNNTTGRLEIFSTASQEDSIMKKSGPLLLLGTMCTINYLGDIEDEKEYKKKVELVFRATSAVPIVFKPVNIENNYYVDGGVSFSSPLSPFMAVQSVNDVLYIYPEDIDIPNPQNPTNAISAAGAYLSQVSRSNYIHDRTGYLQTLSCGNTERLLIIEGDLNNFECAVKETWGKGRMVEVFPLINRSLPIMSYQSKNQILQRLMEQQENFKFRIFYVD